MNPRLKPWVPYAFFNGKIASEKDIGKYIGLVCKDAWIDFEKDIDLTAVDKKDLKYIKGGAPAIIVKLLKESFSC